MTSPWSRGAIVSDHRVRAIVASMACGLALAFLPAPASAASIQCDQAWHHVASPTPAGSGAVLEGVVTVTPFSAWAVGYRIDASSTLRTLIERWNGSSWSVVSSPNVGTSDNRLSAVAAVSDSDVWAVGSRSTASGDLYTLIEHFDGSTWSVVPSPNPRSSLDVLHGVAAASATDVWAVGTKAPVGPHGKEAFFTIHFDGSSWSTVPTPRVRGLSGLSAVAIVTSVDVWAVGDRGLAGGGFTTAAIHWDGSSWQVVPTAPTTGVGELNGLALEPPSSTPIAVGQQESDTAIAETWNGSAWMTQPVAPTDFRLARFAAVANAGSSDTWAVGSQDRKNRPAGKALIEGWDGASWSLAPVPRVGKLDWLNAVSGEREFFWAVGATKSSALGPSATMIDGYCRPVPVAAANDA